MFKFSVIANNATYDLQRSAAVVDEGSYFTITINTTGVQDGQPLPYTITGCSSEDLNGEPLSGNFTIHNNTASKTFNVTADSLTEGEEVMTLTLGTGSIIVVLNDTSLTPVVTDPYWNSVVLLIDGAAIDAANNHTFVDSSPNNFSLTRLGLATQGAANPFGSNWGVQLNTAASQTGAIQLPATANNTTGTTGDFTIECWAQKQANNALMVIAMISGLTKTFARFNSDGSINGLVTCSAAQADHRVFAPYGKWFHIAACRHNGVRYSYINGVMVSAVADTNNYTLNGGSGYTQAQIGNYNNSTGQEWVGSISNFRIVNGSAVYPSGTTFVPPTSPLTAITGTIVLACSSNRFVDKSQYSSALVLSGSPKVVRGPFTDSEYTSAGRGGSMYTLAANGSYIQTSTYDANLTFGTGDFTVEFWVYPTASTRQDWFDMRAASGTNRLLIAYKDSLIKYESGDVSAATTRISSSSAITPNQWYHIALSRSAGQTKMFVNGAQIGNTYADTTNWTQPMRVVMGRDISGSTYTSGYMAGVRVVKGYALYTTPFTVPSAPVTSVAGTQLLCHFDAAGAVDRTTKNDLVTNGVITSTATTKYGDSSIKFDGVGDYVSLAYDTQQHRWWDADFTVECWINVTNLSTASYVNSTFTQSVLLGNRSPTTNINYWSFGPTTTGALTWYWLNSTPTGTSLTTSAGLVTAGSWHHIAMTFVASTNTVRLFVNGTQQLSQVISTASLPSDNTAQPLCIGSGNNISLNAYVEGLRITRGAARYVNSFTPPSGRFKAA